MIPSGCRVCMPVTSPSSAAFPKTFKWVGFPESIREETPCGMIFEIVAIPYVQASWFARHPVSPLPLRRRKLAGQPVTFTPEQIMHRSLCMHRVC